MTAVTGQDKVTRQDEPPTRGGAVGSEVDSACASRSEDETGA